MAKLHFLAESVAMWLTSHQWNVGETIWASSGPESEHAPLMPLKHLLPTGQSPVIQFLTTNNVLMSPQERVGALIWKEQGFYIPQIETAYSLECWFDMMPEGEINLSP